MSEGKITPGDPLGGGGGPAPERPSVPLEKRHESGLPMPPSVPSSPPAPGYSSPPPPGAGGMPWASAQGGTGDLRLSGWWRRVGAAVIDGLIVTVVALILLIPFGIGFAGTESDAGIGALIFAGFVTGLVFVIAAFLYAPLLMAKTNGKTVGRMATGIRVVRTNGQPMDFGWSMLREVAVKGLLINAIGGSLTFGLASLLDVLWPLWDEENRALHDFLVSTRTVLD